MMGAPDNEGMWEGLRITQSRKDRQIKRLNFRQIKDTNLLNVRNITNRSQISCWTSGRWGYTDLGEEVLAVQAQ